MTHFSNIKYFRNNIFDSLNIIEKSAVIHDDIDNLYLLDGSNQSIRYGLGIFKLDEKTISTTIRNIADRKRYCDSHGVKYIQVYFQNKENCYRDYIGKEFSTNYISLAKKIKDREDDVVYIDLPEQVDGSPTFMKTDTHLSHAGNVMSTSIMLSALDISQHDKYDVMLGPVSKKQFSGDLGIRFSPKHTEEISFLLNKEKNLNYYNNVRNRGALRIYTNTTSQNDNTILIFGDSFMWGIAPLLSAVFRKVVFLHSSLFHYELVSLINPEYVINASVERFLMNVLSDHDRPMAFDIPIYYGKSGVDEQFKCVERHYQLNPYSEFHRYNYAQAIARSGDVLSAISLLEEIELNHPDALMTLARFYMNRKMFDQAIYCLKQSISINPSICGYYVHLSKAYKSQGDIELALLMAEKALSLRPNSDDIKKMVFEITNIN